MSKTSDLQLIDKAFYALERALESKADRDWRTYYQQNLDEEKDHRRFLSFAPNIPHGITRNQAAKLFCVLQVVQYLNGDKEPKVEDIFSLRLSIYMASALVTRYRELIISALAPFNLQALLALDYAELNKAA